MTFIFGLDKQYVIGLAQVGVIGYEVLTVLII